MKDSRREGRNISKWFPVGFIPFRLRVQKSESTSETWAPKRYDVMNVPFQAAGQTLFVEKKGKMILHAEDKNSKMETNVTNPDLDLGV